MTDRPIIFSAPMVRALLARRKTQTRRLVTMRDERGLGYYLDAYCSEPITAANPRGMSREWNWWTADHRCGPLACKVPAVPGDRLWVREAHAGGTPGVANVLYRAGHEEEPSSGPRVDMRWHPSIHMPRWASRITLEVTDVRVQRLQDISEEDAKAEGVQNDTDGWIDYLMPSTQACANARGSFDTLWNSLHGPDASAANPWVAALTFTVTHANIDASATARAA